VELFSNMRVNTNGLDVIPTIFNRSRVETGVYTNDGILCLHALHVINTLIDTNDVLNLQHLRFSRW